jgi:hypothetical protein
MAVRVSENVSASRKCVVRELKMGIGCCEDFLLIVGIPPFVFGLEWGELGL